MYNIPHHRKSFKHHSSQLYFGVLSMDTAVNFGRAIARLGLEDKVLKNGILPERKLLERSQIVQGMIDTLFEQGKWSKVVELVYGDGPARLLYDGDRTELDRRITQAIQPKDFEYLTRTQDWSVYGHSGIKLLLSQGKEDIIYNAALREDMPPIMAQILLYVVKKELIGEKRWNEGANTIAERFLPDNPEQAYILFKSADNLVAIEQLYQTVMANFSLDNVSFALLLAEDKFRRVEPKKVQEIVQAAVEKKDPAHASIYLRLYNEVKKERIPLDDKVKDALGVLAVPAIPAYQIVRGEREPFSPTRDSEYPELQLEWAKVHWEQEPTTAYAFFRDAHYEGAEVLSCAMKAVERMGGVILEYGRIGPAVKIELTHLRAIYELTPTDSLKLREQLARALEDKNELARISETLAESNPRNAYHLRWESGNHNDELMDKLRNILIDESLASMDKSGTNSYFYLEIGDLRGEQMAYERFLPEFPVAAFNAAKILHDEPKLEAVRNRIFEKNTLEICLSFFKNVNDQTGYERAVDLLAAKYELPHDQMTHLLTLF